MDIHILFYDLWFMIPQWKSGVVKQLGWTISDDLLCVQEDGTVLVYDLFGSFKRHFSMGNVRKKVPADHPYKHLSHDILMNSEPHCLYLLGSTFYCLHLC